MSEFRLRTLHTCESTIVTTRGDIDIATAPVLEKHLTALASQGRRHLVLNLSHTAYMDSSGLAAVMRTHKTLGHLGGDLAVIGCQPSVGRILNLVGFHHLFTVQDRSTRRPRREVQPAPVVAPAV
ncbi:MAG: STAS domain-containing protein [Capsulimonas sp.]|uniref:STAS domain-containing protein n=1 Tax=Capsulimonas sp. TaxID=2494211 RepID=UPI00326457E1